MEGLARLVSDSLARHGFETTLDCRRLQWSQWFRCHDSFSVLLVPGKPGLFALGEELIAAGEIPATRGKRMLALYRISETEDLGMALGRLFLPGNPERERLSTGRCFARYAVIEDAGQRRAAHTVRSSGWHPRQKPLPASMANRLRRRLPGAFRKLLK